MSFVGLTTLNWLFDGGLRMSDADRDSGSGVGEVILGVEVGICERISGVTWNFSSSDENMNT